ncbi:SCO3242 family prenyltransferase [Streptomyces sp. HNA39]|uniref:SCO3242 family prenyltransferase n=1 Tax=Streptomyces sp. HNA39 TaxID=2850561 RepID=UPI00200E82AD|nr:UbiA family prenyltransferase [Streptomyces sp. HNA39]
MLRVPRGAPGRTPEDGLSGTGGTAPAPDRLRPSPGRGRGDTVRAWSELFRVSALFSVPGDALAGAAAVGRGPGRGTALAIGASLCLYEAGMALNDWADREEDAVDRPHRPIPSGRVSPAAALGAAGVLTAAGLALAARAGRPALAVATGLAATVWAYDLRLKHTKAGPAAMAAARSLDLLLGATATAAGSGTVATARGGGDNVAARIAFVRGPLPAALALGAHTYGVTAVSRHEAQGGSTAVPLAVLATTAALGAAVLTADRAARTQGPREHRPTRPHHLTPADLLLTAFTGAYLRAAGPPLLHAALNPSPPLIQRAVGGGIRAMVPLQAALAARNGAPGSGLAVMALVPLARALARKVSPT